MIAFTTYPDQFRSTILAPDTTTPTRGLSNLDPTCITFRRAPVHVIVFRSDLRNHLRCFPPPPTCTHTGRVIGLVFPQCRLTGLSPREAGHCQGSCQYKKAEGFICCAGTVWVCKASSPVKIGAEPVRVHLTKSGLVRLVRVLSPSQPLSENDRFSDEI